MRYEEQSTERERPTIGRADGETERHPTGSTDNRTYGLSERDPRDRRT